MILPILQIGDPVLRAKAEPIQHIREYETLISDMIETLQATQGVGLAAPQCGVSIQLFVIRPKPTIHRPTLIDRGPQIIINPVITKHSPTQEEDREGCLSIPELKGKVPRRSRVELDYLDEEGSKQIKKFDGFEARIVQHEYDHLQGIFFLERMSSFESLCTTERYTKRTTK